MSNPTDVVPTQSGTTPGLNTSDPAAQTYGALEQPSSQPDTEMGCGEWIDLVRQPVNPNWKEDTRVKYIEQCQRGLSRARTDLCLLAWRAGSELNRLKEEWGDENWKETFMKQNFSFGPYFAADTYMMLARYFKEDELDGMTLPEAYSCARQRQRAATRKPRRHIPSALRA